MCNGRSVHNVRIERLWVDVTAQLGAKWADIFTELELRYGLDINNTNHIWLLHHLFLSTINQELAFFAESWNQHRIQMRDGPNRSPADMFVFDTLVQGVRGGQLPDAMDSEELEVYGVDWEALRDDRLLRSQRANNSNSEGSSSWIGRTGPPGDLNEVYLEAPRSPLPPQDIGLLNGALQEPIGTDGADIIERWRHGLAYARSLYNNLF